MELSAQFSVKHLCDVLDINRSGFYKWKKRLEHPSERLKTYVSNLMLFKEKDLAHLQPEQILLKNW